MAVCFYLLTYPVKVRYDFNNIICIKEFKRKEFTPKSKGLTALGHNNTGLIHVNTPEFIGLSQDNIQRYQQCYACSTL